MVLKVCIEVPQPDVEKKSDKFKAALGIVENTYPNIAAFKQAMALSGLRHHICNTKGERKAGLRLSDYAPETPVKVLTWEPIMSASSATEDVYDASEKVANMAPKAGCVIGGVAGGVGALVGVAALGPVALLGAAAAAATGAAGGYQKGMNVAAMAADGVKYVGGLHEMTCEKCGKLFDTTKQLGQEGYGICQQCRSAPDSSFCVGQTDHVELSTASPSAPSAKRDVNNRKDIMKAQAELKAKAPLHEKASMLNSPSASNPQSPTSPQMTPTNPSKPSFYVGQTVNVKRSNGEWSHAHILSISPDETVVVDFGGGNHKQVPLLEQASMLKLPSASNPQSPTSPQMTPTSPTKPLFYVGQTVNVKRSSGEWSHAHILSMSPDETVVVDFGGGNHKQVPLHEQASMLKLP